ncbi:MAG: DNA-binding domain-containing protein [Magnetovibrionaceae bacterium]
MDQLAKLQADFQAYLLGQSRAIEERLVDRPEGGLAVYHSAYVARIQEALAADFPRTKDYLGEETFDGEARAYLAANPSRHPSIRWVGKTFGEFLESRSRDDAGALARFEWTLGLAFDGAAADPLDESVFAEIPPEAWADVIFQAQPNLRLLALGKDAPAWWKSGKEPAPLTPRPITWAVWRSPFDEQVMFRALDDDEAWTMGALLRGEPFGALCEGLGAFRDLELAAPRAAEILRGLLDAGLLTDLRLSD